MKREDNYSNYNAFLKSKFYDLNEKEYKVFMNYFDKNYSKILPKNSDISVLDVGCGLGHFLMFLKQKGYKDINGIDLDEDNIKHCQSLGFNNTVKADMFDHFKECKDKYDVVVLNDVIEHVPKDMLIGVMRDINSALKENGILVLKTCNCNNVYGLSSFFADFTHEVGFTKEKMIQTGYMSGFEAINVFNIYLYTNIRPVDIVLNCYMKIYYKFRTIQFLLNGRKNNDVHSKNLLAVLEK